MIRIILEDLQDDQYNAGKITIETFEVDCVEVLRKCCDAMKGYGYHQESIEDAILELSEEISIAEGYKNEEHERGEDE